jgi:DNA-binding NtrC family response regulator
MREKFDELVQHFVDKGFFLEEAVELLERSMIERSLTRNAGNQSAASKDLGIHRNTLQRKMVEYQLDGARPRRKPPASSNGHAPLAKRFNFLR